jgi:hypothetical protein
MGSFYRIKALLAKAEVTYGVDAGPTGAANAMLVTAGKVTPIEAQEVSRELDTPYLGAQPVVFTNKHVSIAGDIEAVGSGTAGTAPAWSPLIRACGMAETVTAATKVEYKPTAASSSATAYYHINGTVHKALGWRSNLQLKMSAGQIPKFSLSGKGLFAAPVAGAMPALTLSAFQKPVPVSDAATPTVQLDGYDCVMSEFELDLGNDVQGRFLVGQEQIVITDRKVTGKINIEAPDLATKDFFALAGGAGVPFLLTHGTVAGKIIEIAGASVQIGRPEYVEVQKITHLQIPLTFLPVDGDDELVITVK